MGIEKVSHNFSLNSPERSFRRVEQRHVPIDRDFSPSTIFEQSFLASVSAPVERATFSPDTKKESHTHEHDDCDCESSVEKEMGAESKLTGKKPTIGEKIKGIFKEAKRYGLHVREAWSHATIGEKAILLVGASIVALGFISWAPVITAPLTAWLYAGSGLSFFNASIAYFLTSEMFLIPFGAAITFFGPKCMRKPTKRILGKLWNEVRDAAVGVKNFFTGKKKEAPVTAPA